MRMSLSLVDTDQNIFVCGNFSLRPTFNDLYLMHIVVNV